MREEEEDRLLSCLPDDILIEIISCLPLRSAMATACFSSRWRALPTHISSIHLASSEFPRKPNPTTFHETLTRITSPSIRTFTLDFPHQSHYQTLDLNYAWLHHFCDRNLREFKAIGTHTHYRYPPVSRLPDFICQTQSLVSIELGSTWSLQLPDEEGVPINLPNLNKLHLSHSCLNPNLEALQTLIKACPALEQLSFQYECPHTASRPYCSTTVNIILINISHQNLRRLFVKGLLGNHRVVLNAPKLEYLAIHVATLATFCFEEKSMVLREAQIDITNSYRGRITEDYIKLMSEFLGVFSNVVIRTPNVFLRRNPCWPSGMFCNATQLTLSTDTSHDINTLLVILELCPVLDILTLRIWGLDDYTIGPVSTLRRALKKIKIKNKCETDATKPRESLLELLLCKLIELEDESFHVIVNWSNGDHGSTEYARNREMKLRDRLYYHPVISGRCEIEFVGRFLKMSRKGRHKIKVDS